MSGEETGQPALVVAQLSMKSFTQRWREASDEAEDQPMEDTPTDTKEAQDEPEGEDCNHANECGFCRARKILLEEQTERADRLQAEVEEFRAKVITERQVSDALGRLNDRLTAELDAVRKDAEWLRSTLTNREKTLTNTGNDLVDARTQRDAAQAKCAEIERRCNLWIEELREAAARGCLYERIQTLLTPPTQHASAWRPIETAPKTGERILGWCYNWSDNFIVKWSPGRPAPHWTVDSGAVTESAPTHWQPLPAPPEEKRP